MEEGDGVEAGAALHLHRDLLRGDLDQGSNIDGRRADGEAAGYQWPRSLPSCP